MAQRVSTNFIRATTKYVGIRPPPKNMVTVTSESINRLPGK